MPSCSVTSARPRSSSTSGGSASVSRVIATSGLSRSARGRAAPAKVAITSSSPFQWNIVEKTRGVPSEATYATLDDPGGVARALDHIGERWALLIVRELLLGP